MPGAQPHPQASWAEKENAHKSSGRAEIARHSLRNGFTAAPRSPRGTGLASPRHLADSSSTKLVPSVGGTGPHGLTVRSFLARHARNQRPPQPVPRFVAIMIRPSCWDRMRGILPVFCPTAEAIYFFRKGWTDQNSLRSQRKSDFRRRPWVETKSTAKPGI
jgi:hypothetical protein